MDQLQQHILRAWQDKNIIYYLVLMPLSWFFALLTAIRRFLYRTGLLRSHALPVPVIVVGNINMGGSGKTPVVIWLAQQLKQQGYHPGIISRGYKGKADAPISVEQNSAVTLVGDEPLLIARRTACPVWIGADRVEVARALLKSHPECDVVISDDGMQHYRLQRTVEVAVVDEQTLKAQQRLLPAGPLREPVSRLAQVDAIVCHGGGKALPNAFAMQLCGETFYNLADPVTKVGNEYFLQKQVKALAGIGKPERFFNTLTNLGVVFEGIGFNDHHAFTAADLESIQCEALVMTEKDAVKCQAFAKAHYWVLPVEAKIDDGLLTTVLERLNQSQHIKGQ